MENVVQYLHEMLGEMMAEFLWFWLTAAMLIVLGVLFGTVFFRNSAPRKKLDKLQEVLFQKKR